MNIFIIHAHWCNRGDEAAVRAMIDELIIKYPDAKVKIQLCTNSIENLPFKKESVEIVKYYLTRKNIVEAIAGYFTKGKLVFSSIGKSFFNTVNNSDLVLHAPGGPNIGDIYARAEYSYLLRLLIVKRFKKPYIFYAPSMGPFDLKRRNFIRRLVLNNAEKIILRENISNEYLEELGINKKAVVTLDAAFQNKIDKKSNHNLLLKDKKLCEFLEKTDKIIGITITDLNWNPRYQNKEELKHNIIQTFSVTIHNLVERGYYCLFIPQLFGENNDSILMKKFMNSNSLILDETYDCYFQQFIISKLYAVIGMRYHSNIFSAKMGTPFVSISYEQKMKGFMEKSGLQDYCIDVSDLSYDSLIHKFEILEDQYDNYKNYLEIEGKILKSESYKTSEIVFDYIDNNLKNNRILSKNKEI